MLKPPARLAGPLLGAMLLTSACATGYTRTTLGVNARLGPPIEVYDYYPDYFGDWHTRWNGWAPVTIYEYQGAYYSRNIRGARPLQVYRTPSGYLLPPRDNDWARTDRRFSSKKRPTPDDYARARPRPAHTPPS